MSMVKPIGIAKDAFDATKEETFYFTSSGGDQVVYNKIIIRDNSNNQIVYENQTESYSFSQVVPANTLENGKQYNFSFITYNIDSEASPSSDPLLFWCYTEPTLTLDIRQDEEVKSSSRDFTATYNQTEGERLDFIMFILYDINKNIVAQTDELTTTDAPPNVFIHRFSGFENDSSYYIRAVGVTIDGTELDTGFILFNVRYENPSMFNYIEVKTLCDQGYNQIRSNVKLLNGKYGGMASVQYIDDTKAVLIDPINKAYTKTIWWEDYNDYVISDGNFIIKMWYEIGYIGKQFRLVNAENPSTYIEGEWVRGVPEDGTRVRDWLVVTGYVNNVPKFRMKSNYIELVNNTANLVLWFKYSVDNNKFELKINSYDQVDSFANWNDGTNIEYDRLTNLKYTKDHYEEIGTVILNEDLESYFPIAKVQIWNGIYDYLYITNDMTQNYVRDYNPTKFDEWDYTTLLLCDFDNNIYGGNLHVSPEEIDYIYVKGREKGTYQWFTLYKYTVSSDSTSIKIVARDYTPPSGITMEYALVPVIGGIEGNYTISEITTYWRRLFVTNSEGITLSLLGSVEYGGFEHNANVGVLQPINSKYPITIRDSKVDYVSLTISGVLLNDSVTQLNENVHIDSGLTKDNRQEIVKLKERWNSLIRSGSLLIKDWNGYSYIVSATSGLSYSPSITMGNGYGTISFDVVQQGEWNNEDDLYKNGFLQILST